MTSTRHTYDELSGVYLPVALVVFGVVVVAIAAALLLRRDVPPGVDRVMHIAGPAALVVAAAVLVVLTFEATSDETAGASPPALTVRVTASQWMWRFDYGGGVRSAPPASPTAPAVLRVPAGRPVRFVGTSADVDHDFWVPDVRFQRQLFAGRTTTWQLVFPRVGGYQGLCAQFCGLYHQDMHFVVQAMPPARFAAWLKARRSR